VSLINVLLGGERYKRVEELGVVYMGWKHPASQISVPLEDFFKV